MKEHTSITIDPVILNRLRRYAQQERRAVSQVVQMALEEFLKRRLDPTDRIVTSPGVFDGRFSREDTYANR